MVKDMTVGKPAKLILSFSIPLLIGNIFQQFYSMVDAIIVGRYVGKEALAAVGATGSLSFLVLGFVIGLTGGFSVVISQRFGAKDEDGLRNSIGVSVYLSIIFTIIITALALLFTKPLLDVMKTPADIYAGSYSYISVIFGGIFAAMIYNMVSGILRALGDSKTPLIFLIIASFLNVILDLVFIINFNMGVAGAAYATVISQAVSGILCFIYMLKKYKILRFQKKDWKFNEKIAEKMVRIGLPMSLQFSITAIGVMILQRPINELGSTVVAAYTAASKVEQLATQPLASLGVTMATYAGQNLGAGRIDRIHQGVKECVKISLVFSILGGLIVVFGGEAIIQMFLPGNEPEVLAAGRQYLNTIAIFFCILGLLFVFRNVLQGMGDAFIPMMAGVGELVARAGIAIIFSKFYGYAAICFAGPGAWVAAGVLLMLAYRVRIKKIQEEYKVAT